MKKRHCGIGRMEFHSTRTLCLSGIPSTRISTHVSRIPLVCFRGPAILEIFEKTSNPFDPRRIIGVKFLLSKQVNFNLNKSLCWQFLEVSSQQPSSLQQICIIFLESHSNDT